MKRIFLAIAVLCYTGAVYGQDGGRIHRSEFVPFDTREDADALNRKNTDKYLVFAPELLNDGEEVLGIGNVVNLPNGWFDSFIYLHLENTGTAYTLRVNDRTVAVVEDPFAPADFDLTPYVKQGDNLILLELHESNTPELQKGFTPTPVKPFTNSYLFAQEKRSIRDFNVALIPDSTRKFGVLDLEVIVQNGYNYEEPITVGFDIYAPNGKLLDFSVNDITVPGRSLDTVRFSPYIYHTYENSWGNPLYRWEKHRETGYQWWITRLWYCFELYDVVRIDHFRGFDEYFSIPYGSETAAPGHWEKGPGIELFRAVEQALGKREIIAEDLGYMSETVRQLVRDSGFPGMKVLEFAFDSRDTGSASDYLPHNYPVNSVAYTGTHDNETLVSWYQTITSAERALVRDYLCDYAMPEAQLYKSMIALIFRSAAATCIIPMQDWLGLDNSARINKPSTVGQNWRWRLKKTQLTKKLQKEICQLTTRYGRMNWA